VLRLHLTEHDAVLPSSARYSASTAGQQAGTGSRCGGLMRPTAVTQEQNPLRDPQDKRLPRIAGPCSLVLFGVTGDLAHNKIMPALYGPG